MPISGIFFLLGSFPMFSEALGFFYEASTCSKRASLSSKRGSILSKRHSEKREQRRSRTGVAVFPNGNSTIQKREQRDME